jgi:hypothetical protein
VALVEALELGSAEQERRMRLVCHVLSGAIRLAEGVLEEVLAGRARCTAAVAASIVLVVPLPGRLLVQLGSRKA